jgi:predicted Zn-dependent protease with MMP-like domain
VYVEPPLHPWDEADLVMVHDLSDVLVHSVCHYFIEVFCKDVR